ncbi:MAG: RimK/LysX family protein [Gammaproteobacteria bacterium]|nr:RimK/LysX family protein [Gammaproteobacteria bacterium]
MRYFLILLFFCSSHATAGSDRLTSIGWIEPVRILPEGMELQAKIDTGADNSSVGVLEWASYNNKGEEWIRFKVRDNRGNSKVFERPLERYTHIKRKKAKPLLRPVVNLWLCLGHQKYLTPVNLSDRQAFNYRMLIGRSFLKGRFLVDSGVSMTQSSDCITSL